MSNFSALERYLLLEAALHDMFVLGEDETAQGNAIGDELERAWYYDLTNDEMIFINKTITERKRKEGRLK